MTGVQTCALPISAIFMMFAVFGFIFALGAFIGDNTEVAYGNLGLGITMIATSIGVLIVGLRQRKKATARIEATIANLLRSNGCIEASLFAEALNISLDDARDVLDTRAQKNNWRRLEMNQYNAKYFTS